MGCGSSFQILTVPNQYEEWNHLTNMRNGITSPKGNGGEHSSPTNPKLALTTKSYSIPAYSDFVVIPKISSPGYFLISINRIMTKQKRVRIVTACHRSYGKNGNRRSKGWKVVSKFRTKRETSTHRSRARISQIFQ